MHVLLRGVVGAQVNKMSVSDLKKELKGAHLVPSARPRTSTHGGTLNKVRDSKLGTRTSTPTLSLTLTLTPNPDPDPNTNPSLH